LNPPGSLLQILIAGLSIVLIDLLLAGDNALVIAMAVRALPPRQRKIALVWGAASAVAIRAAATIVAAQLLNIRFLKMAGGALVIWLAVKVVSDSCKRLDELPVRGSLLQAIWLIAFADITMSIDNVLAIAGAARGSVPLIVFGLGVSIPLVMFSSQLIATMMDRYPFIMYVGVAILARVGTEMILTDPWITQTLNPAQAQIWIAEALAIAAILIVGNRLDRKHKRRKPNA
jgi:YjbE family integral membrane protein